MRYFLKKTKRKNDTYLQIYISKYIPEKKGNRNTSFKTLGYVKEIKEKEGIADPIAFYQEKIKKMNEEIVQTEEKQIGDISVQKNIGFFLLKGIYDKLKLEKTLKIVTSTNKCQFDFMKFFKSMIYSQICNPGSKLKSFEKVLPSLFDSINISYDQILDGVNFLGQDYEKYIEILNHQVNEIYKRSTKNVFFDCTNYYFEIDFEKDDKAKGPSKENRKSPIIGQALMLDSEQIPIAMRMYPGNESEKPKIREMIEDMKERYNLKNRVVQVADKGLNCARNIYSAVVEANDGYIFSKSINGKGLSESEKKRILLKDDLDNKRIDVYDKNTKKHLYSYKSCVDEFDYHCFLDKSDKKETKFNVKEKRIVTFNPSLRAKRLIEIDKEVEKISKNMGIKGIKRQELGDAVKYANIRASDKNGEIADIIVSLNTEKIENDKKYAGFNLLVTSETKMKGQDIYDMYHGLWKIEESFKILKTYLEAKPVYLQKKESIYGHFLICYYALTFLRLLELKEFDSEISTQKIVEFIRNFNVTENYDGTFINTATYSATYKKIKELLGLSKLGNVYLKNKDIQNFLNIEF